MGKKLEKGLAKEKNQSAVSPEDDDPNKTPEPYNCTGNFQADFTELCRRNMLAVTPPVILRPRPPTSPTQVEGKPEKGKDKNKQPVPEPEPEPELTEDGEPVEPPPKTYTVKDKFEYFKPSIQVEMDNPDKPDTVTEVFIRGWRIDESMMNTFRQCWPMMEKLHTINLWNTGLNGQTLTILASFLPQCVNVKNVILDGNTVKEENWHELIGEESLIQNLSVRHCGITDLGADTLGKALGTARKANMKLLSLNLMGNRITDVGAEHLASGLKMNRTLLSLSLASNTIADKGAAKIGEALSRFSLSHEEVVERRRQKSELGSPDRNKSPPPSRRADSKDRPPSVRSTVHADKAGDKGKKAPSAKKKSEAKGKDVKEETHDKKGTKGKDDKGSTKKDTKGKASIAADPGKGGKGKPGKGKDKGKTPQAEQEVSDNPEVINPLLENADFIDGQLWVAGNRVLINLNLSRNKICEFGISGLLKAVQYQTTLTLESKSSGTGLMRILVAKNPISPDHEYMRKLTNIMQPKDPFYKPPPQTPEHEVA